jgi:hypothetical protein
VVQEPKYILGNISLYLCTTQGLSRSLKFCVCQHHSTKSKKPSQYGIAHTQDYNGDILLVDRLPSPRKPQQRRPQQLGCTRNLQPHVQQVAGRRNPCPGPCRIVLLVVCCRSFEVMPLRRNGIETAQTFSNLTMTS